MSHMQYTSPVTHEDIEKIREQFPNMGRLEASKLARALKAQEAKRNALEAVENARWKTDTARQVHTVLDVLQYLIQRE